MHIDKKQIPVTGVGWGGVGWGGGGGEWQSQARINGEGCRGEGHLVAPVEFLMLGYTRCGFREQI